MEPEVIYLSPNDAQWLRLLWRDYEKEVHRAERAKENPFSIRLARFLRVYTEPDPSEVLAMYGRSVQQMRDMYMIPDDWYLHRSRSKFVAP